VGLQLNDILAGKRFWATKEQRYAGIQGFASAVPKSGKVGLSRR
jgi:hypothetical protein